MRLYPKKIHSLEDLEREKKILLKEKRALDKEELSISGLMGGKGGKNKKKDDDDEDGGGIMNLISMLPISNPLVSTGIKLAYGWFSKKREKNTRRSFVGDSAEPKKKHPVRTIAVEILGGYLKWKAIELSYKGIRNLMKNRGQ